MALVELNNPSGGTSGEFIPTFDSAFLNVASGASGDVIVLTPPEGERVKLRQLRFASANFEPIDVEINGKVVITGDLSDTAPNNIGKYIINDAVNGGISHIFGGVNDVIKVVKPSGSTSQTIVYMYQFGVMK